MTRFSANLGFLWADLPLPEAIVAAGQAGFDAVECHWPFDTPAKDVNAALAEADLPMLGLNTRAGRTGDFGLTAVPGREAGARAAIDEAVDYARQVNARHVHALAGNAEGKEARRTFLDNLDYATSISADLTILIEPLNAHDAPDYFLGSIEQTRGIIADLDAPNLKLMFDCYHVGRTEGDVIETLRKALPIVGHIQFASVPNRTAPDTGAVNYGSVFAAIDALGWSVPLGAEYRPDGPTEASLSWMKTLL